MSNAHSRTAFSRKAIAIAVASAVTFSGVNTVVPHSSVLAAPTAVAQDATVGQQTIDGIEYTAPHRFNAADAKGHYSIHFEEGARNVTKVILGENDAALPTGDIKVPHGTWVKDKSSDSNGKSEASFNFKPDTKTPLTPKQAVEAALVIQTGNGQSTRVSVPHRPNSPHASVLTSQTEAGQAGSWINVQKLVPQGWEIATTDEPAGTWEYDDAGGTIRFVPKTGLQAATSLRDTSLDVVAPNGDQQQTGFTVLGYPTNPQSPSFNIEMKFNEERTYLTSAPVDLRSIERTTGISREEFLALQRTDIDRADSIANNRANPAFFSADVPAGTTFDTSSWGYPTDGFNEAFGEDAKIASDISVPGQGRWVVSATENIDVVQFLFIPDDPLTVTSGSIDFRLFSQTLHEQVTPTSGLSRQDPLADFEKDLVENSLWDKGTLYYKIVDKFSETPVEEVSNPPAQDLHIINVEKQENGDYLVTRSDGETWTIKLNDGAVTDIKTDGKGNLVITINGEEKTVPLEQVKVTEENKGTPNHTVTITTPDGQSVTFNVFDIYVTDIRWNEEKGVYEVYRSDVDGGKTVWKTIDLSDLRNRIEALEKKDSPSREEYNTLVTELKEIRELVEKIKEQNNTDQEKITIIEKEITNLQNDLDDIKDRLTKVENHTDALTKCLYGGGLVGIPALLALPLLLLTQIRIPAIEQLNTQIQQQLGIYNPEIARTWGQSGGVLQAGAVLAGLAGLIGGIAYLSKECAPLTKTPAAQDTDLGKISSKLQAGSSQKD
ncbi:hypothetical protein [Corynebacterium meitnerae]|uniref:Uncharacterized protein n=1 Tax=Corynebacterium meitnerae TaxID=2913498 RepID=A0A9X3LS02_9CORY|nr:hypothetical protein [Corynebacterium meitnerae]MCZ9293172.1 hypothetical protein [Corynebacterium meitnerae]